MLEYLKNMLFKKCFNGHNLLFVLYDGNHGFFLSNCVLCPLTNVEIFMKTSKLAHPNISYVTRKRLTKKQKILYDVQIPKKNSVRQQCSNIYTS